jgi:hypothetical protein
MKTTTTLLVLLGVTFGCSESRAIGPDVPAALDGALPMNASSPSDVQPFVDAAADTDAPQLVDVAVTTDSASLRVVINEVRGIGDDWVELYNPATSPVEIAGFGLTDTDTTVDGGAPRVASATRFPTGTVLMPGQRLIVVADLADAGSGTEMNCLMGAVMRCYTATWGISGSRGETIYLLDRGDQIVDQSAHPADSMIVSGQTWCRLPDGTGAFAVCAPTPEAANRGI